MEAAFKLEVVDVGECRNVQWRAQQAPLVHLIIFE